MLLQVITPATAENSGTSSYPYQTSALYGDVNSVPQTYPLSPIKVYDYTNNYSIGLFDWDGGTSSNPDDFMGGIYFKPNDYRQGSPQTIHLSTSKIDLTVYLIWNY